MYLLIAMFFKDIALDVKDSLFKILFSFPL